jgi:hypothetical protein
MGHLDSIFRCNLRLVTITTCGKVNNNLHSETRFRMVNKECIDNLLP